MGADTGGAAGDLEATRKKLLALRQRRRPTTLGGGNRGEAGADTSTGDDTKLLVAVRVRPLTRVESEESQGDEDAKVLDKRFVVVAHRPEDKDDPLRANRVQEKKYAFDYAFDPYCSQQEIYNLTTRGLVDGVLEGFNATVFAYGATGAGKTYTMIGSDSQPGIMVLTLQDLFERIQSIRHQEYEYKVTFNYLEVYNENIRDLLSPDTSYLDLREDPVKGMCVAGISDWEVTSASEIMELLRQGNVHRTQEPTGANAYSSRSHAVLQVTVQRKDRTPDTTTPVRVAKLSLVDLAGSERAAKTKNQGMRMIEGANINRSLLALGNCINALGDPRAQGGKGAYVPFRDSKLTRLLKDSLGGNCRTTMIANIAPSRASLEETLNTLKYANRAKNIQLKVKANVTNVEAHIAEYAQIISDLRTEIHSLKLALVEAANNPSTPANNRPGTQDTQESRLLESLQNKIMQNFEDRMQIQRSMLDLEELQIQNTGEVIRLERYIQRWEEMNPDTREAEAPKEVRMKRLEMNHIQANTDRNAELKEVLVKRLAECDMAAKEQREAFPQLLAGADRRSLLEMEFRMRLLEVHNMELEEHTLMRDNMMRDHRTLLESLSTQLDLRDRIIARQRELLRAHEVPIPEDLEADYEAYDKEIDHVHDIVVSVTQPSVLKLPEIVAKNHMDTPARTRTATTKKAQAIAEKRIQRDIAAAPPQEPPPALPADTPPPPHREGFAAASSSIQEADDNGAGHRESVHDSAGPPSISVTGSAVAPQPKKGGGGRESAPSPAEDNSLPSLDHSSRSNHPPSSKTTQQSNLERASMARSISRGRESRFPSAGRVRPNRIPSASSDHDSRLGALRKPHRSTDDSQLDLIGRVPFRGSEPSVRKPAPRAVRSAVPPRRGLQDAEIRAKQDAQARRSARMRERASLRDNDKAPEKLPLLAGGRAVPSGRSVESGRRGAPVGAPGGMTPERKSLASGRRVPAPAGGMTPDRKPAYGKGPPESKSSYVRKSVLPAKAPVPGRSTAAALDRQLSGERRQLHATNADPTSNGNPSDDIRLTGRSVDAALSSKAARQGASSVRANLAGLKKLYGKRASITKENEGGTGDEAAVQPSALNSAREKLSSSGSAAPGADPGADSAR